MKTIVLSLCLFLTLLSVANSAYVRHQYILGGGGVVSLRPSNYPTYMLRYRPNFEVWIDPADQIQSENQVNAMAFKPVAGLCGTPNTVSFQAVDFPSYYIRHSSFLAFVQKNDNSALFSKDACFYMRDPLAVGSGGYSFESVNYPGYYLRHSSYRVRLDSFVNTDLYRHDATFMLSDSQYHQYSLEGLGQISLRPSNYPTYVLRHRPNLEVWIDPIDQVRNENQWNAMVFKPVSGLCGNPGTVSFESVDYPGYYIRHSSFLGFVHRNDNSALFQNDACFFVRDPLVSGSDGYTFESVNYPGYCLRHSSYRVRLDSFVGTDLYRHDATWMLGGTK